MDKEYSIEIKEIDKTSVKEHILNGAKALVAAIPFVGGSLNSLMNDYIPDFKRERLKKIVEKIGTDVNGIKETLNKEYITTEEFAYYFEISIKKSLEEYNEEKIRYYIGFLVGNLDKNKNSSNDEKDFYLKLIEKLTPLQLKIIRFLRNPEKYFEEEGLDKNKVNNGMYGTSFSKMFELAFNSFDQNIVIKSFGELYTYGFTNTKEHIFGTTTANTGFDIVKGRLNGIAEKFIQFCEGY